MTPSQLLAVLMDDVGDIKNLVVVVEDHHDSLSVGYTGMATADIIMASKILDNKCHRMLNEMTVISE